MSLIGVTSGYSKLQKLARSSRRGLVSIPNELFGSPWLVVSCGKKFLLH